MSRAKLFGAGSTFSATKFGVLNRDAATVESLPQKFKDAARLENQRHVMKDTTRERRYMFCRKCGITTVTIGFNNTPSARLGLWGRCVEDKDYTHHQFVNLSAMEYERLRDWPTDRRLTYWNFER